MTTAASTGCSATSVPPTWGSTPWPAARPRSTGSTRRATTQMRPGCWDIHERVRDMNANGVLGSLNFPTFPHFCGQLFARAQDKDLALAVVRAYNDWHIDEWCGTYPGPLHPVRDHAVLGPAGDGRRSAAGRGEGLHAVTFSENPESSGTRACTATTGTRSGRRARTPAPSCACTSGRRRRCCSPRPTRPPT